MRYKKLSIKIVAFAFLFYVVYSTYFYIVQRDMIFPTAFVKVPSGIAELIPDSSKLWIENDFGTTESWYLPPSNIEVNQVYPLMIIAHGNGDVIDKWVNITTYLRENGIAVLLVEYPGYGRSEGNPNQDDITEVFVKSYDIITNKQEVDKSKIIFLGQSIGGGAICALANIRTSAAMILISTFTSINIFASQYFLPKFLVKDKFDNLSVVSNYNEPILLVHGKKDKLIPVNEAYKLNEAAPNSELRILNGGHNTIKDWTSFWRDVVFPFLHNNEIL
jgi:pimeloyl-ACP methyl ester carboxylesterase